MTSQEEQEMLKMAIVLEPDDYELEGDFVVGIGTHRLRSYRKLSEFTAPLEQERDELKTQIENARQIAYRVELENQELKAKLDKLEKRSVHAALLGDREIHSLRAELERLKKELKE